MNRKSETQRSVILSESRLRWVSLCFVRLWARSKYQNLGGTGWSSGHSVAFNLRFIYATSSENRDPRRFQPDITIPHPLECGRGEKSCSIDMALRRSAGISTSPSTDIRNLYRNLLSTIRLLDLNIYSLDPLERKTSVRNELFRQGKWYALK